MLSVTMTGRPKSWNAVPLAMVDGSITGTSFVRRTDLDLANRGERCRGHDPMRWVDVITLSCRQAVDQRIWIGEVQCASGDPSARGGCP